MNNVLLAVFAIALVTSMPVAAESTCVSEREMEIFEGDWGFHEHETLGMVRGYTYNDGEFLIKLERNNKYFAKITGIMDNGVITGDTLIIDNDREGDFYGTYENYGGDWIVVNGFFDGKYGWMVLEIR